MTLDAKEARDALFERIMDRFSADPSLNITAHKDWRTSPPAQIEMLRRQIIDPIIDETLACIGAGPPARSVVVDVEASCSCGPSHAPGCPNSGEGVITQDGAAVEYHRPELEGVICEVQHSIGSGKPITTDAGGVGIGVVVLPTGQPRVIMQTKHPDGTSLGAIFNARTVATLKECLEDSGAKAQAIADAAAAAPRN